MVDEISSVINDNNTLFSRPNILLTGLRRSGKTSIQRVIFTKMAPSQTQFLKSTPQLTVNKFSCSSFISLQIHELPGQLRIFPSLQLPNNVGESNAQSPLFTDNNTTHLVEAGYNIERLLKRCSAVVYIIDAQDDYAQSVSSLNMIIESGQRVNPRLRYEIFIHKVDQLSEEEKVEAQQDIHNRATNENASNVFDSMSSSIVKLTGGRALYLKEINRHLALTCVLREEALTKQAIIEYNVNQLKKSILELFNLTHQISSSPLP
ncbi:unnamed protein product [Rotaria socialis]|uniref:GTP-binding protein n=2 Tax=Rotaria socialis TaxID=392032 RepID=A0A817LJG8_9BILA|nr:unnamed protein product [Rotaria socialis]